MDSSLFAGGSRPTSTWRLDAARGPFTPSFNHLVSAGEQSWRHFEAERLGGFEIDHQLEARRLHYGKLGWLFALENPTCVDSDLAICVREDVSVAHQATDRSKLP